MQANVVRLAQALNKGTKDAEIDIEALKGLCERLGWALDGPRYAVVQDKAGSVSRKDEALYPHQVDASDDLRSPEGVLRAIVRKSEFFQNKDYGHRKFPNGVRIVDEVPRRGEEGVRYAVGVRVEKEPGWRGEPFWQATWKSYYSAKAYDISKPGTSQAFTVQQSSAGEWKQPAFWRWARTSGLAADAKEMLDNICDFEKAWLLRHRSNDNPDVGTCACCFGTFVLDRRFEPPKMVLHGYQRPGWGYILGRCPGIDYPPYELSDEGTRYMLGQIEPRYLQLKSQWEDYETGKYANKKLPAYWVQDFRRQEEAHYGRSTDKFVVRTGYVEPGDKDYLRVYGQMGMMLGSETRQAEHQVDFLRGKIRDWKLRPLPIERLRAQQADKPAEPSFVLPEGYQSGMGGKSRTVHAIARRHSMWVPACAGSLRGAQKTGAYPTTHPMEVTCDRCKKALRRKG
jgi:hypothetical protein